MKVTYVFPVTNQKYDLETFFKKFSSEKFFKKYKNWDLFFVVDANNSVCRESAFKLATKNTNIKVVELEKKFNYGAGFKACVPYINSDVTLLGDLEISNNAELFEKMMLKYKEGANIVHVKLQRSGASAFFERTRHTFYNMFVKMFTGHHDAMALTSIQLLDSLVIDVLSTLPDKSNYLRNCVGLEGIVTETIYIDAKTPHYKLDYVVKSTSMILCTIMSVITILSVLGLVLINTIGTKNLLALNIILIFVLLISIMTIMITVNKHILDVRNDNLKLKNSLIKCVNVSKEG